MPDNRSISRSIAEGTFWVSFFGILTKVVAVVSAVLVLRKLSIHEYGLSELAMSVVSFLGIFMLPGMMQAIVADISNAIGQRNLPRAKEIGSNFFKLQLCLCGIAFVLMFALSFVSGLFFTENVSNSLRVLSFVFLLAPFRSYFNLLFSVSKDFFALGALSFFEESFRLLLIYMLFAGTTWRIEAVFLGSIGGQILALIALLGLFHKNYRLFASVYKSSTRPFGESLLNHGKWSVASSYFNTFGQNMRLWIIQFFLGTGAVSLFSLAFSLLTHTQSLISFSTTLAPILSEHNEDRRLINVIIAKSIKYQMFIFVLIGVICFFLVPVLVLNLFPKYAEALPLYNILLISMIPASFAIVFTPMFHAKKEQKSLFKAIGVKNAAIAVFSVIMLPIFGITGAAIEYLLTLITFLAERYRVLKRIYGGFSIRWKDFISFDQTDRNIIEKVLSKRRYFSK